MKASSILTLLSTVGLALVIGACDDGQATLTDGRTAGDRTPSTTPGDNGDFNHPGGPSAPGAGEEFVDPAQVRAVGSPEVTSRLHGCGKLTVGSIGQLLQSRGLTGQGPGRPPNTQNGQQIFNANDTAAALGAANYNARVPEAPFSTTSAVSKMFDIYTMSSYDVLAPDFDAPACPGVKVIGTDGKFTKDGISCLIGKPASEEHVAIANDAVAKNPTDGAKIAIAALLSAAHTCQ
jgi:hypothetical protein